MTKYEITKTKYEYFCDNYLNSGMCARGGKTYKETQIVEAEFFKNYLRNSIWTSKNGIFDDSLDGIKLIDMIKFYIEDQRNFETDVVVEKIKKGK